MSFSTQKSAPLLSALLILGMVITTFANVFFLPPIPKAQADISTGLVGHWTFDGTSNDASGQGNHGTFEGGTPTYTAGKLNQAISLDGIDDHIAVTTDAFRTTEATWSAWIQRRSTGVNTYILSYGVNSSDRFLVRADHSCCVGALAFHDDIDNEGQNPIIRNNAFPLNDWAHIAVVFTSDGTKTAYVDGVLVGADTDGNNLSGIGTSATLYMGSQIAGNDTLNGLIDDVRIYSRALSAADVAELYTLGTDATPPTRTNGQPSGTLPSGTAQTTLSLSTDEPATCRFSTTANTGYASMPNTFSSTGDTSHATTISGLQNGQSYAYYARCIDSAGNANTNDLTISFSIANPVGSDITSNLTAHYTFDNTTNDTSGNNRHGTAVGSPVYSTGKLNQAISLDGVDDYVDINPFTADLSQGDYTISLWVKHTATAVDTPFALRSGGSSVHETALMLLNHPSAGQSNFRVNGIAQAATVNTGDGTWHHLVGVREGGANRLYVDGVERTQGTAANAAAGTHRLVLGTNHGGPAGNLNQTQWYTGALDDVRIYSRALSSADITALYNLSGTTPTDTTPPSTPTLSVPTAVSSSQINLSWTAATDSESSIQNYKLYWCSGSTSCSPSTVITLGNTTSYSHTGRPASTVHRYQVAAVNGVGLEGARSAIQQVTTPNTTTPPPSLKAFPTAEGFGTDTTHGRGGRIVYVTNLNDSGPGSLRHALEVETGPRIVVFRVGGTIHLQSIIRMLEPNSHVYIAGQTAPGGGIAIRNWPIQLGAAKHGAGDGVHDVVIRHLRLRNGVDGYPHEEDTSCSGKALCISARQGGNAPVYNVVVDHSTMSWGWDDTVGIGDNLYNITVQWSMIAEALYPGTTACEGMIDGPEQACKGQGWAAGMGGPITSTFSFHHNLIAHNGIRNPSDGSQLYPSDGSRPTLYDLRNNIIYHWGIAATQIAAHLAPGQPHGVPAGAGRPGINAVNNLYRPGSGSHTRNTILTYGGVDIYLSGNWGPFCPTGCGGDERLI